MAELACDVVVLDYGSGNLRSAVRALERAGASVALTSDFQDALDASGLVVPGVGAYAACMRGLRAIKGDRIIGRRLAGGRPVLGICVGMQVLFARGVEHGVKTEGCDEWPGVVERLQAPVVPHMGWNTVDVPDGTSLFAGVEDERFYFVHSYALRDWTLVTNDRTRAPLVTWAEHGGDRFVAAVENGPLSATQFHPEKSGDAGAALLRNSGSPPSEMPDWPVVPLWFFLVGVGFCRGGATYLIGRGGRRLAQRHRSDDPDWVRRGEDVVRRFGAPAVTLCFLTVGLQTAVLLAAGTLRMAPRRFVPALLVGALLWASVYVSVGIAVLEAFWGSGRGWLLLAAVVGVALMVWGVRRVLTRRASR